MTKEETEGLASEIFDLASDVSHLVVLKEEGRDKPEDRKTIDGLLKKISELSDKLYEIKADGS